MNAWRLPLAGLLPALFLSLTACGKTPYSIDMLNYGQHGVILLKVGEQEGAVRKPYRVKMASGRERWVTNVVYPGLEDIPFVIAMTPTIPSQYRDPTSAFGRFKGYENKLPDKVEIVWQLAELKDCDDESQIKGREPTPYNIEKREWLESNGFNPDDHVRKSGCTWSPLPGKVFREELDMKAIRDSEAYRQASRGLFGSPFDRHAMLIELIFQEDQLTVKTYDRKVNVWK